MEGYLKKESPALGRGMQERYFRLTGSTLSYYKDDKDSVAKGMISLRQRDAAPLASRVYPIALSCLPPHPPTRARAVHAHHCAASTACRTPSRCAHTHEERRRK